MTSIDISKKISELKEKGITILEDQFTIDECNEYIDRFEKIIDEFKRKKINLNSNCQLIKNPYRHDRELSLIHI